VIEVANSSLAYDRGEKASIYARMGIPEYWILNVVDRQLEVHLDPGPSAKAFLGFGYATCQVLSIDDRVVARFLPRAEFLVRHLLEEPG